jgi:serine/threonine protein phosphatase PrpC
MTGSVRPRRLARRGVVSAGGLFFGEVASEAAVRARILALYEVGCGVVRTGMGLAMLFSVPRRVRAEAAPGTPLCACVAPGGHRALSACPLEEDELAALAPPDGAIVLARAGVARAVSASDREDPSTWIDAAAFTRVDVVSLGNPPAPPRLPAPPVSIDVRHALKVPAAAPEMQAARAELARVAGDAAMDRGPGVLAALWGFVAGAGGGGLGAASRLAGALASILAWLAPRAAGGGASSRRSLAAVPQRPAGPSFLDRARSAMLNLAARLLVLARLATFVGRQHARYLARMVEMFERGDYQEALRHAVPVKGEGKDGATPPPALLPMRPRDDLAIRPRLGAARGAILVGPDLLTDLRAMYRRAYERLAEQGQIERAAFVLAELLEANEEAVSFLERHGRYRLAAEIAEARGLPPSLVVRQWLLAGDTERAIAIARRTGAFADAITRLERSGPEHATLATALRLVWADLLASSGAYAAAVDVAWPCEAARTLARAWIDRAIDAGGVTGARMLARKASLGPLVFADVLATLTRLLAEPHAEADASRLAFARALADGPVSPETRALARPTLRALLGARPRTGARGPIDALLAFSADAALRTDVRPLLAVARTARIRVAVGAGTALGQRSINEDAFDFGHLREGGRKRGGPLGAAGYVLTVVDGVGGAASGEVVARMAADIIFDVLSRTAGEGGPRPRDVLARDLVLAVKEANRRIFEEAQKNPRMRGSGATVTCAALVDAVLLVAQVGDTRAYVLRDGELAQITRDHSLVNALLDKGDLRPEDVEAFEHKNVVTLALGMSAEIEPTLSATPLQNGDVVLLVTDGAWSVGDGDQAFRRVLVAESDPRRAARALVGFAYQDNATSVAARFTGEDLPASLHTRPVGLPYEPAPDSLAEAGEPPLATRAEPRVHERRAAAVGSLPIHDAVRLPDGGFLVALGEAGARVLSPDGRVRAHFGQPAHALVMSDHGDRAIAIAHRGEASRLSKLDLAGRRVRPWRDAVLDQAARSFDGETFFVARGTRVYAIDAVSERWEAIWSVTVDGAIVGLDRSARELGVATRSKDRVEVWSYELPGFVLRKRSPHFGDPARPLEASASGAYPGPWRVEHEEAARLVVRDRGGVVRLRVALAGASRADARVGQSEVIVWDDTGRLLVIELRTGGIVRELLLAP